METKPKPRIFLDSSVFLSGLCSGEGPAGTILKGFIDGRFSLVMSRQVLDEVVRTVREKVPEALPCLRKLLVSAPPEIREDVSREEAAHWARVVDMRDAGVLAAAAAARPDYLVTESRSFLRKRKAAGKRGLETLTPEQFLERWSAGAEGS